MDIGNTVLMSMLQDKMSYHATRQNIIAQNIANADNPEYRRRDIAKPNFKGMVKNSMLSLETTNPHHLSSADSNINYAILETDSPITLDMEAFEMSKNTSEFAKVSTTYKKMISLMNIAAGTK